MLQSVSLSDIMPTSLFSPAEELHFLPFIFYDFQLQVSGIYSDPHWIQSHSDANFVTLLGDIMTAVCPSEDKVGIMITLIF